MPLKGSIGLVIWLLLRHLKIQMGPRTLSEFRFWLLSNLIILPHASFNTYFGPMIYFPTCRRQQRPCQAWQQWQRATPTTRVCPASWLLRPLGWMVGAGAPGPCPPTWAAPHPGLGRGLPSTGGLTGVTTQTVTRWHPHSFSTSTYKILKKYIENRIQLLFLH